MPTFNITKQIFLCGLPSVGKTFFGKFLAQFLSLPFFDTDHLLSARFLGDSPKMIYQCYGEEGFCQKELAALISVPAIPSVVALGGHTPLNEQAYEHILQQKNAILVLLDAPLTILCQRLQQRPLPTATSPQYITTACQDFCSRFLTIKETAYA